MKKYIKANQYTPQQGDNVVGYTYFPRLRKLWDAKTKILLIALVLLFLAWQMMNSTANLVEEISKEQIDAKIAEKYEEKYEVQFKTDENRIRELETKEMEVRVKTKLEAIKAGYWKEAKEEILGGIKSYIAASPEVVSFVIDFDKLESQKYISIDDFLEKNYPTSRLIGYDIKGHCKRNEMTEEQCLLLLGIAGKESAFDTAYVKNDWSPAITEGRARNNMFGLKANSRYIDTKCDWDLISPYKGINCREKYSSIPYDEFAFVPFNTFESGLDWFMNDTLKKGYPSVWNPHQMIGHYNNNYQWAESVEHFIKILKPLLNYNQ